MKFIPRIVLLTLLTSTLAVSASLSQPLPLDTAVHTGRLPNGLTYYIRHNEQPKDRVLIYLVNNVGSVLEDNDQQGLAHFMEHMNFNGTTHFPKNELIDYLQRNGVRFGADINAYTSFDETVFELPIPSNKPDVLRTGLTIVHDWSQGALLDPTEIDKERGVVLEEKRLGKGAGERMRRIYWPVILDNSRYAQRLPIGVDSVLNHFTPATIRRFHHDWYRPDLQAVIVVGDIDAAAMEKAIRTQFADLKNPAAERPRTRYQIPLTDANRFVSVTDREMTNTQAEALIKIPGLVIRTAADYRKDIIRELFDQMMAGRLAELTRQANPPFLGANIGFGGFIDGLDIFDASVNAKPGELEKGFKAVWREVIRAKRFGFTQTELDRAKSEYLSEIERAWKEKNKTESQSFVQEYQEYFLKGTASPGIDAEYKLVRQDLPGVTIADVNALLTAGATDHGRTILILAPDKDKGNLPDSATATGWLTQVEAENLTAYQDQVSAKSLLITPPTAGTIVSEQKDDKLGLTTWTLSNGATVRIKPTDFKNDEIVFSAYGPGGTSLSSDADYQSAANAAMLVGAGGAGNYDLNELQKYLAGKQVNLRFQINERDQVINGSTTPADLHTAMELLYADWTEPRKDTAVVNSILDRSRANIANRSADPNSVFSDTVNAVLGDYNLRRTGPTIAKINEIDLDKSYQFFKDSYSDASGFTFTFVGSVNLDSLRPLVEQYLASLPSTHSNVQPKDLGIHIPSGVSTHVAHKGTEPKATVYLVLSGWFDYSPENVVRLDALRECLEIRLLERLREDESGVYSPGVRVNSSKLPRGRYAFYINFGCAPENVDKLVASTLDEINKLRTEGPLPANLQKWRAEDRTSRETQLKTNRFWLGYLQGQIVNQEPLDEIQGYDKIADAVTVQALKDAANKYLDGKNLIRLELEPEKK
ncbi:MAG TPA: insulinase family protein [Puia sp.]|nr:insulinase family protein [Puia sp.]